MFEGFKSKYVKVKKGKVFCKIKGDGPPLLLLHGYPCLLYTSPSPRDDR